MARSEVAETLHLADPATLADLRTYVGRARRVDPDGVTRLVGHGAVLAAYVSPVHGGGGPVVLGLRTLALGAPSALDVTVPLSGLADRLARDVPSSGPSAPAGGGSVALPDAASVAVPWAGVSPPRRDWQPVGPVATVLLAERAAAGIAEIAEGAPAGSGAAAVAALRARIWGRPLLGAPDGASADRPGADLPAGVAYAATALGFLGPATSPSPEPAALYRCGPWWRLTTPSGHVLARRPALL